MEVLAEGVETPEQGIFLAAAGCQLFQGNFYGEPMSADELMERIRCGNLSPGYVADGQRGAEYIG
jgi:EAL domain-containing protein (putative c-di-GMP-specific phosphodiesterase class I)